MFWTMFENKLRPLKFYDRAGSAPGSQPSRPSRGAKFTVWIQNAKYELQAAVEAQVQKRLSPMGDVHLENERQIRPLTKLPPERQPAAWQLAVETAPG